MKHMLRVVVLLVSFGTCPSLLSSALAQAPAGNGTLNGFAFRTEGAAGGDRLFVRPGAGAPAGCRPAAGAAVTAVGGLGASVSGLAAATGAFSLSVPGGTYVFRAALTGLASASTAVTVPPGSSLALSAGQGPDGYLAVNGAQGVDASHVDVLFSAPVQAAGASAFSIRPPLAILGASLLGGSGVRLTTAPQAAGTIYVVRAADVRGTDGKLLDPTRASAPFVGIGTAPQVVDAAAVDSMHVDVRFSVPVLAASAGSSDRYAISPYLQVLSAAVLDDGRRVRLITGEQTAGVFYTVRAGGVQDATGTPLDPSRSGAPFVGIGLPPRVVSAQAVDDTHVDVRFNEEVDAGIASQPSNYTIPGLQVLQAWLAGDARVVHLATTEQKSGAPHRVLVSGVRDQVGNAMAAQDAADFIGRGSPPSVVSAYAVDDHQVEVALDELLDPLSVSGMQARMAPALQVNEVLLQADGRTLRLATGEMCGGAEYTVTVSGLRDRAGNAIAAAGSSGAFTGAGTSPRVVAAWVVDATHVDARFSEPVQGPGSYSTNPYLDVTGAVLQPDGVTVRITTAEMTAGTAYTLYASDVLDRAGNPLDPSGSTASFGGAGGAPRVLSARAKDSVTVEVIYSEKVSPATAEVVTNYGFSPALEVSFLQLQGDGQTVRLTTAEQTDGVPYQVAVTNVQDSAGNSMGSANNKGSFTGIGERPTASVAVPADDTHVDVSFSEPVQFTSANVVGNYTLSPPLPVTDAVLDPDGLTLHLATEEQTGNVLYTLVARNVTDLAGNVIGATGNAVTFTGIGTPPRVTSAVSNSPTEIDVLFNEPLDAPSANTIGNYAFAPPLLVSAAQIQQGATSVRLTTAEQTDGAGYLLTVSGVKDLAQNLVASPDDSAYFAGIGTPPKVTGASAVDATTVEVAFDEPLDAASAALPANYTLDPALSITGATLQAGNVVHLTTDYQSATSYTVTVSGVTDTAGNAVDPGAASAVFGGASALTLTGFGVTQVAGAAGSNLGVYEYRVTYTSLPNTAPESVTLTVRTPGGGDVGAFAMYKALESDSNYADGCDYVWRSSVLTGGAGGYSCEVTATAGTLSAPAITASGPTVTNVDTSRVAFTSDRDGNDEIYVMNAGGSGPNRLTK